MVFQKFQKRTNNSSNFAQNSGNKDGNSNFRKRGDKGFDPKSSGQRDDTSELRIRQSIENEAIDTKYGFDRVKETKEMVGWLLNLHPTEVLDEDKRLIAAVDYYFIQDDGTRFKATLSFQPYFYLLANDGFEKEVQLYLTKKYAGLIASVEILSKEDLDLANHLVGLKRKYLKLSFLNVNDLMKVKREIMPAIKKNKERLKENTVYSEMLKQNYLGDVNIFEEKKATDHLENIVDIREYDVPYHVRVSIDKKIFVGVWYRVSFNVSRKFEPEIQRRHDLIENPDCIVLAFDIETTKLPLKFPDSAVDQIIMISYMIDGQGFLINNREILSADVEDFEYTPKPEYEGIFTVFNEPDEKSVLQRFFDHILDIKPHIFVTYNGDFFDWPFVETRSVHHGLNMNKEIGFKEGKDGVYAARPAIHMDAFNWVKRDSYLPVGSQNLKAVARAKLRYDPVELDPEDMCRMAAEQPQILSNYSVSDAVATYYLYMQYVHPFIFALCTIIPWEPDEVLRKGSGTLCETLLMVEAFHANIIFPNKQESVLNKLTTDGHLLDQETYVGGHVEALESGVFRADIPYRFKLEPEIFDKLISNVEKTLKHALIEEEKIPLDEVENFDEIAQEIKDKLFKLRDNPIRQELPLIYHLDVGAMYPNIILTNRLQPSAMVNEVICAACDFNKPGAKCQRSMLWTWRGEFMPATRNEFYRIQQQLEMERFPPVIPGEAMRAYHQLSKEEQASYEKKRLQDYCRKAYKKVHVTRIEERTQTVCQRENSFYVDTVRAFRDRRYEYKALNKSAKKAVQDALAKGDAAEIKSARNVEITYDSLQLAHKCILNSFYGYVMRRGARWHSMEMAGIVCHTGSNIIKKAREIIERVGRPLELDTDGIWCMLPISFPENFVIKTKLPKKPKVTVSFPNAVLNLMVKDEFTNDQYHDLIDKETLDYEVKSENSIFFEVDGPYLAMILPAAKEEGKKLKKRYAVFNQDKSLAELKGFEVKRRGELQLIKNFQSSVFDAFLKGDTLETCYQAVAKVANYWLDVLYSKALDMPDPELFDLISENRSMSRKLEDYGAQKSTSISTAKRLAEFLGDQMVKDAGLSCKFIISKKPDGAPVTERAIPLAIFQAEPSVKRHYIRRWLKDNSIIDFDIRALLDWDYYIERLGGTIQKIITIPAALQGVSNPVPRVAHPDWLHKRILEKTDVLKQRKINELFKPTTKVYATLEDQEDEDVENIDAEGVDNNDEMDIEDIGKKSRGGKKAKNKKTMVSINNSRKRNKSGDEDYSKHWKEILGPPPPQDSLVEWVQYQKKKWAYQSRQRLEKTKRLRLSLSNANDDDDLQMHNMAVANRRSNVGPMTIGGFLRRNQQTLLETPWQVLQVIETGHPGIFKIWALIGAELHQIKLSVPRIFYLNLREAKTVEQEHWRKCSRILPRMHPVHNLYEYCVPEEVFRTAKKGFLSDLSLPDVAGLYETQMPLDFRVFVQIGNLCTVDRQAARKIKDIADGFDLNQLIFRPMKKDFPYMDLNTLKHVYVYQHKTGTKCMIGIFFPLSNKANIFLLDTVKSNQMPNLSNLYSVLRAERLEKDGEKYLPAENYTFDIEFETDTGKLFRQISKVLQSYKDEKRGPTFLAVQSLLTLQRWSTLVPLMAEFPMIPIHIRDVDNLYSVLDWQRVGSRFMVKHYLRLSQVIETFIATSRYFQVPIGNIPSDTTIFGCDIFYARHLMKQNFVLWASTTERPDFGGKEADDSRLMTEIDDQNTITINHEGCYQSVCIEIEIDGLAVNTLLQSHHVNDVEGTCATVAFDNIPQASLEEMMGNAGQATHTTYDETALCSAAFRVLRGMVNSWLREVSVNLNPLADFQLMNFYRWLRTPSAYLYDPALRKTLNNLMKKLFLQLVAEFMKLGAVVIFADFGKIVICTKKSRVSDALGYVDYIINSIKTKELFHSIEFKISKCWENLLWLDAVNYGGVVAEDEESKNKKRSSSKSTVRKSKKKIQETPEDDSNSESSGEESEPEEIDNDEEEEEEIKCDMNWSIVNYLPPVANCKFNFHIAVKTYIIAIYTHLSGEYENHVPGETPVRKRSSQQTPRRKHNNPMMQNTIQYAKELILGKFSQNLFTIVEKMDKRYPDPVKLVDDDDENVNFRATLINSEKPSLQFIKIITRVLGVDTNIESEVAKMRKDLLKLIEIGEFSEKAEWVEPCASIILPEVICRICNQCRDIDLTKDINVKVENDLPVWFCPACDGSYETANIEIALIDSISRKSMTLVLQDLQCSKCQKIQDLNVRQRCSCSGELSTLIDGKINICRLRAYKGLAIHFGMPLLLQNVEWILKMN